MSVSQHIPAQASVPYAFVGLLQERLRAAGLSNDPAFSLPQSEDADDPLSAFPAREFCDVLERLAEHLQEPLLGLQLGQQFHPKCLGALGYVVATSDNILDAVQRLQRYHFLVYDWGDLRVLAKGDYLVLEWEPSLPKPCALFDEMGVTCFVSSYRALSGDSAAFPHIDFVHPRPSQHRAYSRYFGGRVKFAQQATRIYLPRDYLSKPFMDADPALREMLEQQLAGRRARDSISDVEKSVRREIIRHIYMGLPTSEEIAQVLRLSPRQLRYQLKNQGLNYRDLLNDVFSTLAKSHLESSELSISQIAGLFGYSEQSAFCRAFHKLNGMAPSVYRRESSVGFPRERS